MDLSNRPNSNCVKNGSMPGKSGCSIAARQEAMPSSLHIWILLKKRRVGSGLVFFRVEFDTGAEIQSVVFFLAWLFRSASLTGL